MIFPNFFQMNSFPYVEYLYDNKLKQREYDVHGYPIESAQWLTFSSDRFKSACKRHYNRNDHHWEYHLFYENGDVYSVGMNEDQIKEMVCDWLSTSKMKTNSFDASLWYSKNKSNMVLRSEDREIVERLLGIWSVRMEALYG